MFTPSAFPEHLEMSVEKPPPKPTSKEKLNTFLASRDVSPVRTKMAIPWDKASKRTKRHYIRKAKQVLQATLDEISPANAEYLLKAIKETVELEGVDDVVLLRALADCYENASNWRSRRMI